MDYLTGFGNHFESEAESGALPKNQNSPKKPVMGLVPEQLSGSAFTMARTENLRTWMYRIHPSTLHGDYQPYEQKDWQYLVPSTQKSAPSQFRWSPLATPPQDCDFVDGVKTMVTTSSTEGGVAVSHYYLNKSMGRRYFYNSDAEMLILPEQGGLEVKTELGILHVEPQELVVVPRGMKFQVNPLQEGWCRGYLGENTGHPFVLPDLGPLGANALASPRHFEFPVAAFERKADCQVVCKFNHHFWVYEQAHSPLDVVAWHGNYAPYKYDLRKFNTMGTVSFDHPDPSIYTVLTSPSNTPGKANADFVIFPPRWLVGEETFRPPYYHRNIMSEYMGLIAGEYDAKQGGFVPGGSSLHNCMAAHGPDTATFNKAIQADEAPQKVDKTMAFMFETFHVYHPTQYAMNSESLDKNYRQCWQDFQPLYGKD